MSEISTQFGNQLNGYNKTEVNLFLKSIEEKLQERAAAIDALQQQVAGLEAQLVAASTPESVEAAEKIELYEKLMKKMDGDYQNLLAPAIAKAKAIEDQAAHDYEIRMDQARATAEGIYAQTADRIAAVVDENMDRLYQLLNEFIYSKTLPGRVAAFVKACAAVSEKVAAGLVAASRVPGKAYRVVTVKVQEKVEKVKTAIDTYKQKKLGAAEPVVEDETEVAEEIFAEDIVAEAAAE